MQIVATAVKLAARLVDVVQRPDGGLVVLVYHRVGAHTPVRVDVPTPAFETQMSMLADLGSVLPLDDAVARLVAGEDLWGHVVVTFDDGTADFVDDALPVLCKHGVPATLYVTTKHIEDQLPFPDDGRPASWSSLAEAVSTGIITMGSHTHSHALLDRLAPDAVDDELDRSLDLLGDRLGVRADHFAYPKALAPTPTADIAVRRRFVSAALAGTRANAVGGDPHRLARSPVQATDGDRWFRHKLAGGLRREDDLRRVLNRRRYAGATS